MAVVWCAALSALVLWYLWRFHWCQRRLMAAASCLPCPLALPVIGNTYMAFGGIERITAFMNEMCVKYEGLFCVWLGPIPFFVVSDPEDLKIILNNPKTMEKDDGYHFLKPFLGNGLITCPAALWKRNRRIINPVFNPKKLESSFPRLNVISKAYADNFKLYVGKGEVDIFSNVLANFAESVCQIVIGIDLVLRDNSKALYYSNFMKRVARLLIYRFTKVWLAFDWVFYLIHGKDMTEFNATIEELMSELNEGCRLGEQNEQIFTDNVNIKTAKDECISEDDRNSRNMKEVLIELMEIDPTFTYEDMKYEIITSLAPASDSSTATICFCLLTLANLPSIQDKLHREILDVFQDSERDVTLDDLKNMPYLDCVIKESLRRYRTVPYIARKATDDIKLTTCTIPAGGRIVININGLHISPHLYPEPMLFDPDRFTTENSARRHIYSFLPFSAGPRNCIGKNYSTMAMKIFLINILRKYQVSTTYRLEDIVYKIEISMGSKHGFPISFQLRNKNCL